MSNVPDQLRFERLPSSRLAPASSEAERWLEGQPQYVWLRPVSNSKARTLDQNALMWRIYGIIGKEQGLIPSEAHAFCKLHYGIPILRRDSDRFRAFYDAKIKAMPYASKLRLMEYISVSSLFTTKQAGEYIETIVREQAKEGLVIELPEDTKND